MMKEGPRPWTNDKEGTTMKSNLKTTTVAGKTFTVWSDYMKRGTYAEDENGETRRIAGGNYLVNDLTIRKAIAASFRLHTFRK